MNALFERTEHMMRQHPLECLLIFVISIVLAVVVDVLIRFLTR